MVFVLAALAGCAPDANVSTSAAATPGATSDAMTPAPDGGRLRFVALGDSYTIGTSVAEIDRWPNQLAAELPRLDLLANLGVNGFTSADVIDVELPQLSGLRPDVITLLIGVNDVVQGVSETTYRRNVAQILDELGQAVGAGHALVVTTPDYTVTPAGADYGDPTTQSAAIRRNNAINTELAGARGIAVVDIYDISLGAATDRSLVATDGLHPSGAQYAQWVKRMLPAIERLLESTGSETTPGASGPP